MSGNGTSPERVDYVLVALDAEGGEVETPLGPVAVTMADLDRGITVVGVPGETSGPDRQKLVEALGDASRERGTPRQFIVVDGALGERWKFWRLVRKDRYDAEFDEERVT